MRRHLFYGASFFFILLCSTFVHADTSSVTPSSCDQLYNLPQGTVATPASSAYLNSQTCAAYQYLIPKYNPGGCSAKGLSNPKVQGITGLNPTFAQGLTNMLQAAGTAGFNITINSAYRTTQGETCANSGGFGGNPSGSLHTKGLAADLQYPNDSNSAKGCDSGSGSPAYQWVAANAKRFGLGLYDQLHSHVNGECNHVEFAGTATGSPGPGANGQGTQTGGQTSSPASPSAPASAAPAPMAAPPASVVPSSYQQQLNTQGCFTSVEPIVYNLPGTVYQSQCVAYPSSTTPLQSTQPLQAAPVAASTPAAAATPAASTPAASSAVTTSPVITTGAATTYASPTTLSPTQLLSSSSSVAQFLQQIVNPASAAPGQTAIQTFLSTTSSIYMIVPGQVPVQQQDLTATSSFEGIPTFEQQAPTPYNAAGQYSYSYTSATPLSQILNSLRSVLTSMLSYL